MRSRDDAARRAAWRALWKILLSETSEKDDHVDGQDCEPDRRRGEVEVDRERSSPA